MKERRYRLGCDIGGTFTDFVLLDDMTGEIRTHKLLTTPKDPSDAVEQGIMQMLAGGRGFIEGLDEVIHGTTLIINAIIERKGSTTGLITTKGFRDVLELGRERRYDNYDIFAEYPLPLVERPFRKEVDERVATDGRILKSLDSGEAELVVRDIVGMGIESLAVCLINSFENPEHEIMIKDLATRYAPGLAVSISYEVLPQIREYERTSTTVANAYAKPLTRKYLGQLLDRLRALGFEGKLFIMLSSGGITSVEAARESPVRIIESGPTAAVISAEYYGKMYDIKDIFAFDMGGTTAKSCLIQKGEAGKVSTFEVGRVQRFKKGSGLPIQVPVVDLMEIGAGGGSIAKISKLGLLQVGPESAGADPGPACYGLGGEEPTVTDADLILGYLDPDYFLGGKLNLRRESAETAILQKVAGPLHTTLEQTAWGIHDLINETMTAAAKTHIAEKGGNPRLVTIVAFGGAGPVHAYGLAKKLKASRILVPPIAGVGSALGFFTAPVAFEVVRSHKVRLNEADFTVIEKLFHDMEVAGKEVVQPDRPDEIICERSIDMRFIGQGYEVNVPVPSDNFAHFGKDEMRSLFDQKYKLLYGRTYQDSPLEFVTFKVTVRLPNKPLRLPKITRRASTSALPIKGKRLAYSGIVHGFVPFTVFDRYGLSPGDAFDGPAIVEERESTTVVGEDASVSVDEYGFLWIGFKER